MDFPKAPDDPELKNIIDKLANFVARNGPEFEAMTKQKQKDNPKFSFLFSGDYFNYYQYRVTTEQAILKQQQQKMAQQQAMVQQAITQQAIRTAPWQQQQQQPPHIQQAQVIQDQLEQQRQIAQEEIKRSETNLAAQYQRILQEQQVMIDEAIVNAKKEHIASLSQECEIPLEELNKIVLPIIDSCTKDAISNGKNWIFTHFTSPKSGELITKYLLERILDKNASFELRLHLIYLINDVLHHCMRKSVDDLRKLLEDIVVPAFCVSQLDVDEERKLKLTRLLSLWESNNYFDQGVIDRMKDPDSGMSTYQASLITDHANEVTHISTEMNARYLALQKQHQDFVNHWNSQIAALEQQLLLQSSSTTSLISAASSQMAIGSSATLITQAPPSGIGTSQLSIPLPIVQPLGASQQCSLTSTQQQQSMAQVGGPMAFPPPGFGPPPPLGFSQPPPGFGPLPPPQQFDYAHGQVPPLMGDFGGLPPLSGAGPPPTIHLPDLSKPPPGFPPAGGFPSGPIPPLIPPNSDADLMPSMPYFDLPAGLMAPLVKLEDCDYKPLDPKDIRLPPPMPPTERLLAAVEAFYSPPSHERPRDSEGWEKLGLFEFFKAKQKAKKMKVDRNIGRRRSRSRSRSPSPRPRRRNSRRSRSRSPLEYQRSSRSKSKSKSRSRSRSRSQSRSRSKSRSRSRSPARRRSIEKSPPAAGFFSEPYYQANAESRLGEENKGHQLLTKMGWGGGGLGTREEGIVDPINHADVRDKMDQFKGLGLPMNDPFEQFRKSKSHGFTTRMREKAEAAAATATQTPAA